MKDEIDEFNKLSKMMNKTNITKKKLSSLDKAIKR